MPIDEASEHLIEPGTVARFSLKQQHLHSQYYGSELSSIKQQHRIHPAFRQRQWWYRFLPLTSILIAAVISIALGFLRYRNYTTNGELSNLVQSNRGTVQVFVLIIFQALGALSVLSICAVLNYQSAHLCIKGILVELSTPMVGVLSRID